MRRRGRIGLTVLVFLSLGLFPTVVWAPTDGDNSWNGEPVYLGLNCPQTCFMKEYLCLGERMAPHIYRYPVTAQVYNDTVDANRDCNQLRLNCMNLCYPESHPESRPESNP